jgi:uncharacterized phage protein gp47/JayE
MLTYAGTAFPDWNTGSEGDFGVMMLELFAYVGDIQSFYGDRISQEAYLTTATQRQSLLNISATLGYIPSNGSPSSGIVTFQTSPTGPPVTVPALTQVTSSYSSGVSSQPVIFETQALVVVPGDGGTVSAEVLQGETTTQIVIGTSTAQVGQSFQIPQLGVQDGTVQVFVESADTPGTAQWTYVDFLVDAGPEDLVFTTSTNQAGNTSVVFGDNVNGLIPGLGLTIYATYRVILGAAGNLTAGAVASIATPITGVFIPLLGDNVTPNSSAMTGGSDAESNDSIRSNAPAAYRAQYRAVSPQDFSDLAFNIPGVLMASAIGNHSTSVSLYVLGPNYSPPGPALINLIINYFQGKTLAGVSLSVVSPSIVLVDVGTTGDPMQLVVQPNYLQAGVLAAVQAALTAYLSPPAVSFGQLITVSDLYTLVNSVPGVAYCVIPVFTREDVTQAGITSIQFRANEVPSVGVFNISISGGQ